MKALLLSALAILALALPSAAEARGNGFRGGFRGNVAVRSRGFAVVRQPRVFVAQPQIVVVQPRRRVGIVGRLRGAVRGFRVGG